MRLRELLRDIRGLHLQGLPQHMRDEIRTVTADPEKAEQGTLFVCTSGGFLQNGYGNGAKTAYLRGCRVFLAEHDPVLPPEATVFYCKETEEMLSLLAARLEGNPSKQMRVVGVCGTAGKTGTILMAEEILRRGGIAAGILTPRLARFGTLLLSRGRKLADGAEIQHIMGLMRQAGCQILLVECNSYQLEHHVYDGVTFSACVLSEADPALSELGVHRTAAECRRVLERFLERQAELAILPAGSYFACGAREKRYFGADGNMAVTRMEPWVKNGVAGRRFGVETEQGNYDVFLPVPGDIAVFDALAAAEIARFAGLTAPQIFPCFETLSPMGMLEYLGDVQGAKVYRDSAYLPCTLAGALQNLRPLATGRLILLFGSVGDRAFSRRAPLARAAKADMIYLTADDPNTEDPAEICNELAKELPNGVPYRIIPSREVGVREALDALQTGDVLLLAGKGFPPFHRIRGRETLFDEKELVREYLNTVISR